LAKVTQLNGQIGATILAFLFQHLMRPEFQYRHRWQEGDLMIWDNRCTLHYVVNDYDAPRRMHRISVMV
jgi:taurine dioxygenase